MDLEKKVVWITGASSGLGEAMAYEFNKKGNRLFTKKDVDNFHLIFHLVKERGFTLEGAKKKLRENKSDASNQMEMLKSLKKIRAFLVDLKAEL